MAGIHWAVAFRRFHERHARSLYPFLFTALVAALVADLSVTQPSLMGLTKNTVTQSQRFACGFKANDARANSTEEDGAVDILRLEGLPPAPKK